MVRTRHDMLERVAARPGFNLIEVTIAIFILGVMLVSALNTAAVSRLADYRNSLRSQGLPLAKGLLAEVLEHDYEDPEAPSGVLGPESDEVLTNDRLAADDVDDFHNWVGSPLVDRDGVVVAGFNDWSRIVTVTWVDPSNLNQVSATETGIKKITVTVKKGTAVEVSLSAIRTSAWPKDSEENGVKILYVVTGAMVFNPMTGQSAIIASPTAQEQARIDIWESVGFSVTQITALDAQETFDSEVQSHDVAYISHGADEIAMGLKLKNAGIGVIVEKRELWEDYGFAPNIGGPDNKNDAELIDNTHYITSNHALGTLTICSSNQPFYGLGGQLASGGKVLVKQEQGSQGKNIMIIDIGGGLNGGGTAAGRRAMLPWADPSFDINALNDDGQTLFKRTIEWAASKEDTGG